ncbi:MAG: hypothetical protein ABEJ24_03240 [Candidatus Magasanikbacteria bacterium]
MDRSGTGMSKVIQRIFYKIYLYIFFPADSAGSDENEEEEE